MSDREKTPLFFSGVLFIFRLRASNFEKNWTWNRQFILCGLSVKCQGRVRALGHFVLVSLMISITTIHLRFGCIWYRVMCFMWLHVGCGKDLGHFPHQSAYYFSGMGLPVEVFRPQNVYADLSATPSHIMAQWFHVSQLLVISLYSLTKSVPDPLPIFDTDFQGSALRTTTNV